MLASVRNSTRLERQGKACHSPVEDMKSMIHAWDQGTMAKRLDIAHFSKVYFVNSALRKGSNKKLKARFL
jgi:hypothetical protein